MARGMRLNQINNAACARLRNSAEVQSDLVNRANRISNRAQTIGEGIFGANVQPGKIRARAIVYTGNLAAMRSNANQNILMKSLDAGRD